MEARIINGSSVIFADGFGVVVDKDFSLPYAALICELADECKDYDQGESK